jgi:hypothetical protein
MRRMLDARHALCIALLSALTLASTPRGAAADATDTRWDTVVARLDAVHAALASYSGRNGASYPGHLAELVPDFLDDRSLLIDPFRRTQLETGADGDIVPVSLGYNFAPDIADSDADGVNERGAHYPILRAGRQTGLGVLNMSLSGHLYFSPVDWRPLAVVLGEDYPEVDEEAVASAMDAPEPPAGYVPTARMIEDLAALCALLADRYGDSAARHHGEGLLRAWGHDDEGAAQALAKAITRDPTNIRALFHYACVLDNHVGRRANAIAAYEHVVATGQANAPQWRDAHRRLSKLYARVGASQKHGDLIAAFAVASAPLSPVRQAILVRMHVEAGRYAQAVETGEAFLDAAGRTSNRALATSLADGSEALGSVEATARYQVLAHPALGLVGKKAPRFSVGLAETGRTPLLLSISLGDGGATRDTRAALFDAIHRNYWEAGLQVVSGTTDREHAADPWWADAVRRPGHVVLHGKAATYAAYGIEGSATILVDVDGYVRYVSAAPEDDVDGLLAAVRASLSAYKNPAAHGTLRVAGVARDGDGVPIPGATVALYYRDSVQRALLPMVEGRSHADGSFELATPVVPEGDAPLGSRRYQLVARGEGGLVALMMVGLSGVSATNVRLGFATPRDVSGRITDSEGRPAPGVRVSVQHVTQPVAHESRGRQEAWLYRADAPSGPLDCLTDADGRYTLRNLPTGARVRMIATHADYADGHGEAAPAANGVDITLRRGATLEGVVAYADLLPASGRGFAGAPGVDVRVASVVPDAVSVRYGAAEWQSSPARWFGATVQTDESGRYRIGPLPPGFVNIYAAAPGHTAIAWKAYRLSEGETHDADLYLILGGVVEGTVVDEDTADAVGPSFRPMIHLTGPGTPQSQRVADDGTFQFRAAPGANHLSVDPVTGWEVLDTPDRPQPRIVEVVEGETTGVVIRVKRLEEWDIPPAEVGR